ncbi:MAG: baseplate hub protein, partial [Aeromonas veronii]
MSESRYYKIEVDGEVFAEQTGSRMLRAAFDADIRPGELALCEIRLFNYSQDSLRLVKRGSSISLSAGYSQSSDGWATYNTTEVGQVFTGTVANMATSREGTNIITTLFCTTMTQRERRAVDITAGKNATIVDVLKSIAQVMPRRLAIDESLFADAPLFTSGYTNSDEPVNVLDALAYMFNFDWSDDNGRLVIVKRGKGKPERVTNEINPFNGMIGSP